MKKAKPKFKRSESTFRKRLKRSGWRKPVGRHNKIRLGRAGKPKRVRVGYKNARKVRFILKSGLKEHIVNNIAELQNIQKGEIATLSKVGNKKKIVLLEKAKELKIKFTNVKDIDKTISQIKADHKKKKDGKKKKVEEKTPKKEKKAEAPKPEEKPTEKEEQKTEAPKETLKETTVPKKEIKKVSQPAAKKETKVKQDESKKPKKTSKPSK